MTSAERRARPFLVLLGLGLVVALLAGFVLVRVEWQRIKLEAAMMEATRATRVRPYTAPRIAAAALKTITEHGARADPDRILVRVEQAEVKGEMAKAADGLRLYEAGDTPTVPIQVTIDAQAEISSLGIWRPVRLQATLSARVSPDLAPDRPAVVGWTPTLDESVPRKPSMIKPGMAELLTLLKQHRAARKPRALDTAPVRALLAEKAYGWFPNPATLQLYVDNLDLVGKSKPSKTRTASWAGVTRVGQRIANELAGVGVYTPPVDPSAKAAQE